MKICSFKGCKMWATFNFLTEIKEGLFCCLHRYENMVNIETIKRLSKINSNQQDVILMSGIEILCNNKRKIK